MTTRHLFILGLLAGACLFPAVGETASQPAIRIDWIGGYVSATARGYAKQIGSPMDIENAVDAAKVIAQADLLEAIKGVKIDRQTQVGELMNEQPETTLRVQGVLRNAFQAGGAGITSADGFVVATVEMRVCLYNDGFGCRADAPLVSALPQKAAVRTSHSQKSNQACSLAPDIASSREALKKLAGNSNEAMPFFLVNLQGKPVNTETRDFAVGFESEIGGKCTVYAPDRVDPLVRRNRGTVEIFLHEEDGRSQHGSGTIAFKARGVDRKNFVSVDRSDAYLMNLVNESRKNTPFKEGRVGIAIDD